MALQQCRGRSLQAIFCGCPRLFWVNHYLNGFAWHVRFSPDSDRTADVAGGPVRADFVAKVEHRTTPKISRKWIFRRCCCRKVLWGQYEGRWSFLYETIWSLTSPRAKCISGL